MSWLRDHRWSVAPLIVAAAGLAALGDLEARPWATIVALAALVAAFVWALTRLGAATPPAGVVLAVAAVLRCCLLPLPATLSDDIHRYLWDGRIASAGRNPYFHAPEGTDFDYESAARTLALPVLSIGIGEDPIAPEGARDALLARVPRSAVTRVEIDGILEHRPWKRHFSWARRPQEASSAIGGWLGARPELRSAA
jgi:pimeloyl-ACP methyl ester carboxylesterase